MALGELPAGWLRAKLSDVIEPRGEKTFPAELPDLPFLGMDHVEAQTTRILGSVPASSMKSSAARFFAGDVLYGRLRPYLNKVAQPNFHGLASAEFIVFPDTELLHSKFLRFRLNAADFVSFASHLNEGDRPRVNFDQIGEFELLVPPPAEQHRIVAKIEELFSELDQGVASLKTAREQIKVYRQSLLKNAFEGKLTAAWRAAHRAPQETAAALQQRIAHERQSRYQQQLADWQSAGQAGPKPKSPKPLPPLTAEELAELPELPAGWGWMKYGDLCSLVRNGISAKPEGDSGTPIFRISAVRPMFFDMADIRHIDNCGGEFDSYGLQRGDIVFTRYNGSRQYVGVCAEYRSDEKRLFPDKLVQTRVSSRLLLTSFLEKALNSGASRGFVESKIRTTAGQSGVSGEDIKNIPVPVCCFEEQLEIVQELESKLSEADQLDQTLATALQQADALRQSILKKAFCGQLVKQDKNEEPATILLERIRAGKSNGMSTPRNRQKSG